MLIVYDSMTGNVKRFVSRLDIPSVRITEGLMVSEPFVLVSYTLEGNTPESTWKFLEHNHKYMIGVASSGHPNWGKERFGKCADNINEKYGVPIILKFKSIGTRVERNIFKERVSELYEQLLRT